MAKQKGHRANKPNDSFGTVNDANLYRGKYREEVYQEDEESTTEEENQDPEVKADATPEDQSVTAFAEPTQESSIDYKKRYDDLKKHYDSKLDEWKQEKEQLSAAQQIGAREGVPQTDLPTTPEELREFQEKYPDIYKVVETISTIQADTRLQDLKSEVQVLKEREEKIKVQTAYQELLNAHPDFPQLKEDERFLSWLDDQPETISDGIYKNNSDVRWATRVLDLYKADMNIGKRRTNSNNADAARAVTKTKAKDIVNETASTKKTWKASEIAKLKPWEFDKLESELDDARKEGRIDASS
jgi:hypothetical protein